jgi:hypothetical protein
MQTPLPLYGGIEIAIRSLIAAIAQSVQEAENLLKNLE